MNEIRTQNTTYADYMRAMQHEAEDVVKASSDMSYTNANRHQRRAQAAADRKMRGYSNR